MIKKIDERVIITSLFAIVALGAFLNQTKEQISQYAALFFIALIVAGNLGYFYSKLRKREA
jgi:hypothetical protein